MRNVTLATILLLLFLTACSNEGVVNASSSDSKQYDFEDLDDDWGPEDGDTNGHSSSDVDTDTDSDVDAGGDVDDTDSDEDAGADSDTDSNIDTWSFAVMGDSRGNLLPVNTDVLSKLVKAIVQRDVELVVFIGDAVQGTVLLNFQLPVWVRTMQPLWDVGIPVYPTRGNHEAVGLNINSLGTWQNTFVNDKALPTNGPLGHKKATYSVVHKNAVFISLDQYINEHRVPQDWLDQQLATAEVPHVFVFGHEPAFKVDHADCLDDFPAKRDAFWMSLKSAMARTYFCGHDHFYDHARVNDNDGDPDNDIHQYVVGTSGATLRGWSPPYNGNNGDMTVEQVDHVMGYGYLLVEVSDLVVSLTWIGINGNAGDSWSYSVE